MIKGAQCFEKRLARVLDRGEEIDSLTALIDAVNAKPDLRDDSFEFQDTAIGLDTNVFLRIADDTNSVDYLSSNHKAPVIIPGQSIQEYWNNRPNAQSSLTNELKTKFGKFKKCMEKFDDRFDDYVTKFDNLIKEFTKEHGPMYDKNFIQKVNSMLSAFNEKENVIVPYVSRALFEGITTQRQKTKTPPGFRDGNYNDGDFYIWVDLLKGIHLAQLKNKTFNRVVLVTDDEKSDWSQSKIAHPILVAEMKVLFDVPFEIWRSSRLKKEIKCRKN